MQEGDEIEVRTFKWEPRNLAHCARHRVTPIVVAEVQNEAPLFFLNDPGKTGTHMMIGPDAHGHLWTIVILPTENEGEWKAITGWPSTNSEINEYNGET